MRANQSSKSEEVFMPKLLGRGSFSEVLLIKENGINIACKSIKLPLKANIENLLDEISILKSCNHPNIVKFYKVCMPSFRQINLYLEYIEGAQLDRAYSNKKNEQFLFSWIFQTSLALHHLHDKNIIHRDIKPENIIVTKYGLIKLIDFGLGKVAVNHNSEIIGTPYFIAPQLITNKKVYDKSDIWSLGMTIYYLIHNRSPFILDQKELEPGMNSLLNSKQNSKKKTMQKYFNCVINKDIEYGNNCSQEMKELLKCLLQKDYKKRLSAIEIVNHPILKKRWEVFKSLYRQALSKQNSQHSA